MTNSKSLIQLTGMILFSMAVSLTANDCRAADVTRDEAKSSAISYARREGRAPEHFNVVVDPEVLTYGRLLNAYPELAATFSVERSRRALKGHRFWVVHFAVREIP